MKILVINAGSSSLKYQLIDMTTENAIAKGAVERIGIAGSFLKQKVGDKEKVINKDLANHKEAIALVLSALVDKEFGAIKDMKEVDAVGHRVVHSGEDFDCTVLLNEEIMKICKKNIELAPLHMPANIAGIEACLEVMPNTPMGLVFDTAFHATLPKHAYMYGIKYEDYDNYKIRKYGFHGTSHKYVSQNAIEYLNLKGKESKIVTCHLGNGASISAVKNGVCIDTSMGFTPLAGVLMGTRSGDIDPAILEFLMVKKNFTMQQAVNYLNKECGVYGVSGVSSDFRDLFTAMEEGNERAKLALDMFAYQIKKYIGAYIAAMNGIDCLVFTAGIGENDDYIRSLVCKDMEYFGIDIDLEENKIRKSIIRELNKPNSKTKVLIVPTNEELAIARETKALLK